MEPEEKIARSRQTIARLRRDFQAWLKRPDATAAERQDLRKGLALLERLEKNFEQTVRMARHCVERFEDPFFWDQLPVLRFPGEDE